MELPVFLFWGRYERETAAQGFLFWKKLMPEPFFLPPFFGRANSCVYCVTSTVHFWSYGKNMHEQQVMCEVLLLGTLRLDVLRHGSKLLSLTCVEGWEIPAFLFLLFDAVWCMSLTGSYRFLEERMIWSGLWPWCSIKGQSQAVGTWTPLWQGSADNTWKELINLFWEN